MVKELLVSFPVNAGRALLRQMDAARLEVTAAYWWFVEEDEEWRLFLATPFTSTKGPLYVIERIQHLLQHMPEHEREDLTVREIAVVPTQADEIDYLHSIYGRDIDEADGSFRRVTLERRDPYVYRLK